MTEDELKNGIFDNGIDETEGKSILMKDINWIEVGINKNFEGTFLTQNQFDALVSLGINIGRSSLVNSEFFSDAEKNEKNTDVLLNHLRQKIYSKGIYVLGLDYRRYDEAEMYLYGDYNRNNDLSLDKPFDQN